MEEGHRTHADDHDGRQSVSSRIQSLSRIYLIGFMGAGKSTVGRELSLHLHWPFYDLDKEIENAEKLSVRELFVRFGEARFRRLESEHLRRLSEMPQAVIALGGGAYVDAANREIVDSSGIAVWLDASIASILDRVRPDGTRPLLGNPEEARALYERRLPSYKLARIRVVTDNRLPDAIVEEIVREVSAL